MGILDRVREALGGGPTVQVHVLLRGRIGSGWLDLDEQVRVPEGTTLGGLVEHLEARGTGIRAALEESPHLRDTLMINGERCPLAEHADQVLSDGDQVYLLAPFAGG